MFNHSPNEQNILQCLTKCSMFNVLVTKQCYSVTFTELYFHCKHDTSNLLWVLLFVSVWVYLLVYICVVGGAVASCFISACDSGSSGPDSSCGRGIVLCSWAMHFILSVPLSTQVYKRVSTNLMLGVTLRWTNIPSRKE